MLSKDNEQNLSIVEKIITNNKLEISGAKIEQLYSYKNSRMRNLTIVKIAKKLIIDIIYFEKNSFTSSTQ